MSNVFVAGSTGVVGWRAVRDLVAAGHTVTAAVRSEQKAARLRGLGARTVALNLFDDAAVKRAVPGHDTVINLATHIPPGSRALRRKAWGENDRLRRDVSRSLVDAALAANVERYLQESLALAYPDCGEGWIEEGVPLATTSYNHTVRDAEAQVARFSASGGTGIALRFALFYGPDSTHTAEAIQMLRRRIAPAFGQPRGFASSVSTDDAAAAVAAAMHAPGGVYNVGDDEPLRTRELIDGLAQLLGEKPPRLLPQWMVSLMGEGARMLGRSQRVSNRTLRAATGWAPRHRNVIEGWRALVLPA